MAPDSIDHTASPSAKLEFLESRLVATGRARMLDPASIETPRGAQEHTKVHRGLYIASSTWQQLRQEERHLARVLGVQRGASSEPVFSHISAAILLGMPIYGEIGDRAHLITGSNGIGDLTAEAVRHRSRLDPGDIVEVRGLRCTSPERTLMDLARHWKPETALAAADGYLREQFRVGRLVDTERLQEWRGEMRERLEEVRGRNGARAARGVLHLADPRIDSVLESVSHLQLSRLGFDVALQVPVPSPKGWMYFVDFELLGLDVFVECDGKSKYTEVGLRDGLSANDVLCREKRREDWISGRERKRIIRWGFPEVSSPALLARRLRAFGVPIPRGTR